VKTPDDGEPFWLHADDPTATKWQIRKYDGISWNFFANYGTRAEARAEMTRLQQQQPTSAPDPEAEAATARLYEKIAAIKAKSQKTVEAEEPKKRGRNPRANPRRGTFARVANYSPRSTASGSWRIV
jgi:hypothetical protein